MIQEDKILVRLRFHLEQLLDAQEASGASAGLEARIVATCRAISLLGASFDQAKADMEALRRFVEFTMTNFGEEVAGPLRRAAAAYLDKIKEESSG